MDHEAPVRILVADGDAARAAVVRAALGGESGGAIVTELVDTLPAAFAAIEEGPFDCVLLSTSLSDVADGVRAITDRAPDAAVVVLADDETIVERALDAGAQDCLPNAPGPELAPAVAKAIARARHVAGLRRSEAVYRTVVGELPDAMIVVTDTEMRVTHLDGVLAEQRGHRLAYPGQPIAEIFGPVPMARIEPQLRRAMRGERFTVEWASIRDGRVFLTRFAPLRDGAGHIVGSVSVAIDVNERKEVESTLDASERRRSALADIAPVGILEATTDGVVRYVNPRFCELACVSSEEAIGRRWQEFVHPDDISAVDAQWDTTQGGKREVCVDYRVPRPDGSVIWTSARIGEIRDDIGACVGYVATISDLEEPRRAQEELREAMAVSSAAFEHAPVAMGISDADGRYRQVNSALCELLGRPAEEVVGHRAIEFIHPEHQEASRHAFASVLSGHVDASNAEACVSRPDGTPVWITLQATALRGEHGRPTQVFTQMLDIGERRDHEARLRHLADHDVLTGLVNRRCFEIELKRQIDEDVLPGAVLLLDLDGFKAVNDRHGHHAGDQVLVEVAETLRRHVRRDDIVGRIGGDEFAVLLPRADDAEARGIASRLAIEIAETGVAASIGIATLDGRDLSADEALVRADVAMYEVKRRMRIAGDVA